MDKRESHQNRKVNQMMDESSGEEEEYSDFFKPVFDDWHKGKKNKMVWEENCHGAAGNSSVRKENTFASAASCSGYRNSFEKPGFQGIKIKDTISCSVRAYNGSKDNFSNIYHFWLPQREITLQLLKNLKAEIHDSQVNYNRSQEIFRQTGLKARSEKNSNDQVVDFIASFSAFLSDAASGIVSVAQAFNIDSYQDRFKEIMELDAGVTRKLYKARSQCVAKYHDIEEVMRSFHSDNFNSTIGKISNSLEVGKYWEGMRKAYEKDNMSQLLYVLGEFLEKACQPTKLKEVGDSIEKYVDDNPAALDAFKSTSRATYGAIDTLKLNRTQNKVLKGIDFTTNQLLMIDDRKEIQRLSTMDEDSPQSKLESQIEEAIDHLERELREMENIYFELFRSH